MGTSGKSLDERTRERITKMREQGVTVREAAKAMRVNPSTVQKIFKKRD